MDTISAEDAINRFPFIERITPVPRFREIIAGPMNGAFLAERPSNQFDETRLQQQINQTCELYVIDQYDQIRKIDMHFGRVVIYPVRNMSGGYGGASSEEEPDDDIFKQSESIAEALAREVQEPIKHVVLCLYTSRRSELLSTMTIARVA